MGGGVTKCVQSGTLGRGMGGEQRGPGEALVKGFPMQHVRAFVGKKKKREIDKTEEQGLRQGSLLNHDHGGRGGQLRQNPNQGGWGVLGGGGGVCHKGGCQRLIGRES